MTPPDLDALCARVEALGKKMQPNPDEWQVLRNLTEQERNDLTIYAPVLATAYRELKVRGIFFRASYDYLCGQLGFSQDATSTRDSVLLADASNALAALQAEVSRLTLALKEAREVARKAANRVGHITRPDMSRWDGESDHCDERACVEDCPACAIASWKEPSC